MKTLQTDSVKRKVELEKKTCIYELKINSMWLTFFNNATVSATATGRKSIAVHEIRLVFVGAIWMNYVKKKCKRWVFGFSAILSLKQ